MKEAPSLFLYIFNLALTYLSCSATQFSRNKKATHRGLQSIKRIKVAIYYHLTLKVSHFIYNPIFKITIFKFIQFSELTNLFSNFCL